MILSATNRDLFIIALRVWTRFNSDLDLPPEDVLTLRRHAHPGESRLRIDDLACQIINRELQEPVQQL
jgi:hypothetical protein